MKNRIGFNKNGVGRPPILDDKIKRTISITFKVNSYEMGIIRQLKDVYNENTSDICRKAIRKRYNELSNIEENEY